METAATGTLSNVAGSTHRFGGRVSFEYFDRFSHARRRSSEGTVFETFLNFAKTWGARARMISGILFLCVKSLTRSLQVVDFT
jgi:hypothetical protein